MPLIIPANSITGGFEVANSCRFNSASSEDLRRTKTTSSTLTKFTFSWWFKRSSTGVDHVPFGVWVDGNNRSYIDINDEDRLVFFEKVSAVNNIVLNTSMKFRDLSAWYHVVVIADTTQSTESDRVKFYVNGILQTDFSSSVYPSLNANLFLQNNTSTVYVGSVGLSYWNGYMSEVVYLDGIAGTINDFGEFDADTGIWKPIDVSGLTFGTNGFYLDFENSGSLGADVSGNGNNFTVNNLTAVDQSTDTCTNNFATLNSLSNTVYSVITFSEGNLKATTTAGKYAPAQSTIGFNTGKWYAEFKATDAGNWTMVGIVAQNSTASSQPLGFFSDSYGYIGGSSAGGNNSLMNNDQNTSYAATYGNGDIISIAVDCDNNKLYFGLNGTWLNSGNPESGSTGTGAAFTISSSPTSGFYYFAVANYSGSQTPDWEANFGSPPFTISSGNSDGNGYGNFEYAVPSGYLSLCTKNLSEVLG